MNRYFEKHPSKFVKKVRIVTAQNDDLVRKIERRIRWEIGEHPKQAQVEKL